MIQVAAVPADQQRKYSYNLPLLNAQVFANTRFTNRKMNFLIEKNISRRWKMELDDNQQPHPPDPQEPELQPPPVTGRGFEEWTLNPERLPASTKSMVMLPHC